MHRVFCSSVASPSLRRQALMDVGNVLTQVSYIEFSPDEKYVLSYSSREPTNPLEKAALLVNVFDAQNGAKLRKFEGSIEEFAVGSAATGDGSLKWPIFKWAASGCVSNIPLWSVMPTGGAYGCRSAVTTSCKACLQTQLRPALLLFARSSLHGSGRL